MKHRCAEHLILSGQKIDSHRTQKNLRIGVEDGAGNLWLELAAVEVDMILARQPKSAMAEIFAG